MRVSSLLTVFALVSNGEAATSGMTGLTRSDSDIAVVSRALAAEQQTKRSLRHFDETDAAAPDSTREERSGPSYNFDGLVEDFAHLGFSGGANTAALARGNRNAERIAKQLRAVAKKYPGGLREETLHQLVMVEKMRKTDIATYNKEAGIMYREMDPFPGMKVAPVLESSTGRANQLYAEDGSRLLSCIVASRSPEEGGGDVLLISSSNPKKKDWLLPKGGWDAGEDIEAAAWRELIEEGGVNGHILAPLDPLRFINKDGDSHIYYPFKMHAAMVYDQWAESVRYRIWVSYDDAELLLAGRPEMVEVVKAAREIN
ncbi:hypothetical protein PR001_g25726 [Phytophthora rubi]|uniref:Nudix hydrolase domain-containing protein n=1 Tax=Phytophthora rubi TaxID=129364 RepID=A0A6A3I354_9STRA|nr:hypothetical protein PR002_g25963 [Phytophthora rubi]KAE8975365.1 hypothetical protein PR001_g25726 [Phytophthora rubi]